MGFFGDWLTKFWVLLRWHFVKVLEIKPFLKIDPNGYCPLCGATSGNIQGVTDGTNTVARHHCDVCGWFWDELPVTRIEPNQIVAAVYMHDQEEREKEEEESPSGLRIKPRFVKIPPTGLGGVRVNGEELKQPGLVVSKNVPVEE